MPAESPTVVASHCPLCGTENRCAMELERLTGLPQGPCWCVSASFPPELLAKVPAEVQNKACICARCAADFAQRPPSDRSST